MTKDEPLPIKLASPAQRALAAAGITALKHFCRFTETEIRKMHGLGPNALAQIKKVLAGNGLSFKKE